MSSRQVIMNDYAMARSTEMRRPDSRDAPPQQQGQQGRPGPQLSPPRLSSASRDHSPRPRIVSDIRRAGPFDPRHMPDQRGDPKADLVAIAIQSREDSRGIDPRHQGLPPDHRGDPRAGLGDPRVGLGDPRADALRRSTDPRADLRAAAAAAAVDPRSDLRLLPPSHRGGADPRIVSDPRAQIVDPRRHYPQQHGGPPPAGQSQPQQYFMTDSGKYASHNSNPAAAALNIRELQQQQQTSRSRSPQRGNIIPVSTPPAVLHRQAAGVGGITSGKPIVPKQNAAALGHREVEIYRTNNPEVTISKTSSPRLLHSSAAYKAAISEPAASAAAAAANNAALASLVDVAVQQPKLPERERANLLQQHQQQAMALNHQLRQQQHHQQQQQQQQQQQYDREQQYMAARAATGGRPPLSAPSLASGSGQNSASDLHSAQIVQQVRSEREKQQMYLSSKERMDSEYAASASAAKMSAAVANAAAISSGHSLNANRQAQALAIAAAAKQQDPRYSNAASAVPSANSAGGGQPPNDMTAANLIDAIIHNSLNAGTGDHKPPVGGGGSFPRRSPAEMAASTPQEDAAKAAAYKKQQMAEKAAAASSAAATNGPEDLRPPSNPGSRPGSRPSSSLVIEHAHTNDAGKRTSPVPEGTPANDPYWRKRYAAAAQGGPAPGGSSNMQAPRAGPPGHEERQITRLPTAASNAERPRSSEGRPPGPRIENISPPVATSANPGPQLGVDPRKLNPLDYVKSRIEQEMKKDEDSTPVGASAAPPNSSASVVPPTSSAAASVSNSMKRPLEQNHTSSSSSSVPVSLSMQKPPPSSSNGNGSMPVVVTSAGVSNASAAAASVTTTSSQQQLADGGSSNSGSPKKKFKLAAEESFPPADSPGSEGEMVIDESETATEASSASASKPPSSAANDGNKMTNDSKPAAAPVNKPPRFEPVSDDE